MPKLNIELTPEVLELAAGVRGRSAGIRISSCNNFEVNIGKIQHIHSISKTKL